MSWESIKIREDEKKKLDELKKLERKRNGSNPSYGDLIAEMTDIVLGEEPNKEIEDREKIKKERERDFMELF